MMAIALACLLSATAAAPAAKKKPNLIFMMADVSSLLPNQH